ncbi:MAG: hypothetical protein U0166_17775 [Acidobacteriota bacterium]
MRDGTTASDPATAAIAGALGPLPGRADPRHAAIDLFVVSFASLYLEILLIRWLAANVRLLSYFTNITLIASFFGISLGCLVAKRRTDLLRWWPAAFAVLLGAASVFGTTEIVADMKGQELFHVIGAREGWPVSAVIVLFYVLVVGALLPLGQRLGQDLSAIEPIKAYGVNVAGSIAGVVTFAAFSYTGAPSLVWFALLFAALLALRPPGRAFRPTLVAVAVLSGVVVHRLDPPGIHWSPYHKIRLVPVSAFTPEGEVVVGHQLFINRDLYQFMIDFSPTSRVPRDAFTVMWHSIYEIPYQLGNSKEVLVIGAGSGNDVAAALRAGATHVDAVDIDPVIIASGRQLHPEHPYADPRVTSYCQDGRLFLRESRKSYDLVTMGYVDSQTLFSKMTNVRLDSFIYTLEAIRQVRERLAPDGIFVLSFAATQPWIEWRLAALMETAFGTHPTVYRGVTDTLCVVAIRRDGKPLPVLRLPGVQLVDTTVEKHETVPMTTDDWPFLYVKDRTIPRDYVKVLGILLLLSVLFGIAIARGAKVLEPSMFFLGAAFLLLETLGITKLSLLYGATWIVSAVVIVGFLLAIQAANLVVLRWRPSSLAIPYTVLFVSVAANGAIPVDLFLALPPLVRIAASSFLFCLPVFCAGIVFAARLARAGDVTVAFGANTMGAMVGGVLEYLTMAFGFRSLYAVVLAAYALSLFSGKRSR